MKKNHLLSAAFALTVILTGCANTTDALRYDVKEDIIVIRPENRLPVGTAADKAEGPVFYDVKEDIIVIRPE